MKKENIIEKGTRSIKKGIFVMLMFKKAILLTAFLSISYQSAAQDPADFFAKPDIVPGSTETIHRRSSTYLLTSDALRAGIIPKLIQYYKQIGFFSIAIRDIEYDFLNRISGRGQSDYFQILLSGCLKDSKGPKQFKTSAEQIAPIQMISIKIIAPGKPTKSKGGDLDPYDGYQLKLKPADGGRVEVETLNFCQRP